MVWPSSHFTWVLGSGRHGQSSALKAGVRQLTAGWKRGRQCPLSLALGLALSTGVSATGSTSSVLASQACHEPLDHGHGWPPEDSPSLELELELGVVGVTAPGTHSFSNLQKTKNLEILAKFSSKVHTQPTRGTLGMVGKLPAQPPLKP